MILMTSIPSPAGLSYFPFQAEGIYFALSRPGTLLADEMGVGKTVQAVGVINADPTIGKVLIVCPASMRIPWRRELERWLVRPLNVGVVGVDRLNGEELFLHSQVVIINYDRLHNFKALLQSCQWDLAILDECHYCKSPEARRTKAAIGIQARRRMALSGTPLQNRPAELLPMLTWLDPIHWPKSGWHDYALCYCRAFWNGFAWDTTGASNLPELASRLRETVMIRRTKSEVLPELPPKFRSVIEISPTAHLKAIVQREMDAFIQVERTRQPAKEEYTRAAKRLGVDYERIDWEHLSAARHQTALAKVPLVVEFVQEALESGSGKITIFAHHRDVVANLADGLVKFSPVSLVGGMSPEAKQAAIDTFQNDPTCRVFIGNIEAAGVGITLAPASSHAVFAELSWVPAELTQCEDRLHRIGATGSILIHHLVLEGSLDAIMVRILIAKQAVLDSVLS
jgi:SWI/SNF-related matrix-associated actin-dependent regulator of chromatin subfamily A-like protein 1